MQVKDIQHFTNLVEFLGNALGPDYEIVLYDKESIKAIVHGEISGRKVGDPLINVFKKAFKEKLDEDQDSILNRRVLASNGRVLRCSSFFIKDDDGKTIGIISINFDDNRFRELSELVFRLCHPDSYAERNISIDMRGAKDQETFYDNITEATEEVFKRVVGGANIAPERLTADEKMEIVRQLCSKGVFDLKGAAQAVGSRLGCSQATMYRYIAKAKADLN